MKSSHFSTPFVTGLVFVCLFGGSCFVVAAGGSADILVENLMLDFSIKNSVLSEESGENENGIGLENFRKRLDLNYKDNYVLEKSVRDGWYIANLRIPDLNKINNG